MFWVNEIYSSQKIIISRYADFFKTKIKRWKYNTDDLVCFIQKKHYIHTKCAIFVKMLAHRNLKSSHLFHYSENKHVNYTKISYVSITQNIEVYVKHTYIEYYIE